MTCRELTEFLAEYLSKELASGQLREFERHLEGCEPCVAYLKGYEAAVKLGKVAFKDPDELVPDKVPEELVQAILAARRKQQ